MYYSGLSSGWLQVVPPDCPNDISEAAKDIYHRSSVKLFIEGGPPIITYMYILCFQSGIKKEAK